MFTRKDSHDLISAAQWRAAALLAVVALFAPTASAYQLVLDGEDPVLCIRSGGWELDKTGTFNGSFKFSAPGPGTGASLAVWTIDAIPPGTYDIEFYADNGNFAQNAEFVVEDDTGITTVTRSQNYVGTGWHTLGSFPLNRAGRITQTDHWTGAGTRAIADALRITLQGAPQAPTVNTMPPQVSVCVDDLGTYDPTNPSTYTYQLFNGAPQCSYAVMPSQPYGSAVLNDAQSKGIETLLHQPEQYVGQADTNPADTTRLYVGMTDAQILVALRTNLNAMGSLVNGVNNHQGSRFSQYAQGLGVVMAELKARGQFYFDSRTITDSVAYDVARAAGVLTVERDLFVDGTTVQGTKDFIMSLAEQATYAPTYSHVGICHQRPNTVPGLLQVMPDLQAAGVTLRPVSRALQLIVETDFQPAGSAVTTNGPWQPTIADMMSQECEDGDALELAAGAAGWARFTPDLMWDGMYRVFVGFSAGTENSDAARVTVHSAEGDHVAQLDQTVEPNRWHYLGTRHFAAGAAGFVQIEPAPGANPSFKVKADAVKFQYDAPAPSSVADWRLY